MLSGHRDGAATFRLEEPYGSNDTWLRGASPGYSRIRQPSITTHPRKLCKQPCASKRSIWGYSWLISQFTPSISPPVSHAQISDILKSGKHASLPAKVETSHHPVPAYQSWEVNNIGRADTVPPIFGLPLYLGPRRILLPALPYCVIVEVTRRADSAKCRRIAIYGWSPASAGLRYFNQPEPD